jgi:hypothetical protein
MIKIASYLEKRWSKGIWVARSTGVGLAIVGIMTILGLIIIPSDMNDNNNPTNDSICIKALALCVIICDIVQWLNTLHQS